MSRKKNDKVSINLVSLMDIFTVLVFFLLLSAGDGVEEFVSKGGKLAMPASVVKAEHVDQKKLLVTISEDSVWLNDRSFDDIDVLAGYLGDARPKPQSVILKADAEHAFEDVKSHIDTLVDKGVTGIELLTTQGSPGGGND